eukprot:jgi/Bigna1/140145/aug1.54_g14853
MSSSCIRNQGEGSCLHFNLGTEALSTVPLRFWERLSAVYGDKRYNAVTSPGAVLEGLLSCLLTALQKGRFRTIRQPPLKMSESPLAAAAKYSEEQGKLHHRLDPPPTPFTFGFDRRSQERGESGKPSGEKQRVREKTKPARENEGGEGEEECGIDENASVASSPSAADLKGAKSGCYSPESMEAEDGKGGGGGAGEAEWTDGEQDKEEEESREWAMFGVEELKNRMMMTLTPHQDRYQGSRRQNRDLNINSRWQHDTAELNRKHFLSVLLRLNVRREPWANSSLAGIRILRVDMPICVDKVRKAPSGQCYYRIEEGAPKGAKGWVVGQVPDDVSQQLLVPYLPPSSPLTTTNATTTTNNKMSARVEILPPPSEELRGPRPEAPVISIKGGVPLTRAARRWMGIAARELRSVVATSFANIKISLANSNELIHNMFNANRYGETYERTTAIRGEETGTLSGQGLHPGEELKEEEEEEDDDDNDDYDGDKDDGANDAPVVRISGLLVECAQSQLESVKAERFGPVLIRRLEDTVSPSPLPMEKNRNRAQSQKKDKHKHLTDVRGLKQEQQQQQQHTPGNSNPPPSDDIGSSSTLQNKHTRFESAVKHLGDIIADDFKEPTTKAAREAAAKESLQRRQGGVTTTGKDSSIFGEVHGQLTELRTMHELMQNTGEDFSKLSREITGEREKQTVNRPTRHHSTTRPTRGTQGGRRGSAHHSDGKWKRKRFGIHGSGQRNFKRRGSTESSGR